MEAMVLVGCAVLVVIAGVVGWSLGRHRAHLATTWPSRPTSIERRLSTQPVEEILFGDADKPSLRMSRFEPSAKHLRPMEDASLAELFGRALSFGQLAPILWSTKPLRDGGLVKLTIDSAQLAKDSSGAILPLVRGANGSVTELARVLPASAGLLSGPMVFQLVSVLVAQQHLADISRRLKTINGGVERIQFHLESGQEATAEHAYDHLHVQLAPAALAGEWSPDFHARLGDFEVELARLSVHLGAQLERERTLIEAVELKSFASPKHSLEALEKHCARLERLAGLWVRCHSGRTLGLAVLALSPQPLPVRFDALSRVLERDLNEFLAEQGPFRKTAAAALARIEDASTFFDFALQKGLERARAESRDRILTLLREVDASATMLRREHQSALSVRQALSGPIEVVASWDKQGAVRVLQVSEGRL